MIIEIVIGIVILIIIFGGCLWWSEHQWKKKFREKCRKELEQNKKWDGEFFRELKKVFVEKIKRKYDKRK